MFQPKSIRFVLGLLIIVGLYHAPMHCMMSFNPYDPFPLFSSADPHEFLNTSQKQEKFGFCPDIPSERANITFSPFGQWANTAETEHKDHVPLGDIHGPWNVLGLLYNSANCVVPCAPIDQNAKDLYSTLTSIPFCPTTEKMFFGQEQAMYDAVIQENIGKHFGLVSVPLRYRKTGVRGEVAIRVLTDLGVKLQVGFANIQQLLTPERFVDLAHTDTVNVLGCPIVLCDTDCFNQNVDNLMSQMTDNLAVPRITKLFGIHVTDFKKAGIEDLKLQAFWRHSFAFNEFSSGDIDDWPRFLLTPFAQIIGCIGVCPRRDIDKALAVAFNNDHHDAAGFNIGVCLDFIDTIEACVEGGGSFFSKECQRMRVPTAELQNGIFPCVTQVLYQPGPTWHLIGTLNARRFMGMLSAHIQFVLLNHEEDEFRVTNNSGCPPLYHPGKLRNQSKWSMSLFNAALNYEISPNIALGVLWQVPLKRRNTPKCKTLIGSFVANF